MEPDKPTVKKNKRFLKKQSKLSSWVPPRNTFFAYISILY